MADNLDVLLTHHFSGRLNSAIVEREYDITHPETTDENDGGRAQNSYTNSVEINLMKIEEDEELMMLKITQKALKEVINKQTDECKDVVETRYRERRGRHVSWAAIAWTHDVGESTARRWRNKLKEDLRKSEDVQSNIAKVNDFFEK